jgi:hypothetical protein
MLARLRSTVKLDACYLVEFGGNCFSICASVWKAKIRKIAANSLNRRKLQALTYPLPFLSLRVNFDELRQGEVVSCLRATTMGLPTLRFKGLLRVA